MKNQLYLEYRLTYGYVPGWSYLDRHGDCCQASTTKPFLVSINEDGDSLTEKAMVSISPAELAKAKANYRRLRPYWKAEGQPAPTFRRFIEGAIGAAFSAGCQCEHDCCGHWQRSASAYQTKRREFVAVIHGYRNV